MIRLAAAALLVLAAFAVPVPFLDRAGIVLLAGAMLALSVGRAWRERAALPPPPDAMAGFDGWPQTQAELRGMVERLTQPDEPERVP